MPIGRIPRRRWLQSLAAAPVAVAAAQSTGNAQSPTLPLAADRPILEVTSIDAVADPKPQVLTRDQFAALRKLADLLLPQNGSTPGAVAAEAPEFLDFYLSQSSAARQTLYSDGLDKLNAESRRLTQKPFPEIDAAQAEAVLAPLFAAWTYNPPTDPFARFLREAKEDLFRATTNSKPFADARTGRRASGTNPYWHTID